MQTKQEEQEQEKTTFNIRIMKTTSKSALAKRIAKLNISKNSLVYGWITTLETNQVLRPIFTQGSSWKHSSLVDKEFELTNVLNQLGVEFIKGNDALRGGKNGTFVKITTKIK